MTTGFKRRVKSGTENLLTGGNGGRAVVGGGEIPSAVDHAACWINDEDGTTGGTSYATRPGIRYVSKATPVVGR